MIGPDIDDPDIADLHAQVASRRTEALTQRDSARDLAATYEAEIAMMTPVFAAGRAYYAACKAFLGVVTPQVVAQQEEAIRNLWDAIEAHEDKIEAQDV